MPCPTSARRPSSRRLAPALIAVLSGWGCGGGQGGGPSSSEDAAAEPDAAAAPDLAPDLASPRDTRPPPEAGEPYLLSQTGLYTDVAARVVAPEARPFAPRHQLWADGADKRRWIELPPGAPIDSGDVDHWRFPVGTRVWKEFSRDGKPLETRLIERHGPGPDDYFMGSFVWRADGSDAELRPDGQENINGSAHDAPAAKHCPSCHNGEPGRLLGFSAIQLAGTQAGTGIRLADLIAEGRLTQAPATDGWRPPGDDVTGAALGYLHANCGHCHDQGGLAYRETDLVLRLFVADGLAGATPAATGAYRTTIGVKMQKWRAGTATVRVTAGSPDQSGLVIRMASRARNDQMPPLATEQPDPTGLDAVRRWIGALPP